MKYNRFITTFAAAMTLLICSISVSAQSHHKGEDWKEKVQSEKIAFLSTEIGLTPEEAQEFWPTYNDIRAQQDKAMHEVFKSYRELEKALEENRSEKETSKCLNAYLEALKKQNEIGSASVEKYRKILPDTKVAKIFVAEEKFRRQHIRKLHHRHQEGPGNQANK